MPLILEFLGGLLVEAVGDAFVGIVYLTWRGFVCGIAAGAAAYYLRIEHRPWASAGWTFLVVWLSVTAFWIWYRHHRNKPV